MPKTLAEQAKLEADNAKTKADNAAKAKKTHEAAVKRAKTYPQMTGFTDWVASNVTDLPRASDELVRTWLQTNGKQYSSKIKANAQGKYSDQDRRFVSAHLLVGDDLGAETLSAISGNAKSTDALVHLSDLAARDLGAAFSDPKTRQRLDTMYKAASAEHQKSLVAKAQKDIASGKAVDVNSLPLTEQQKKEATDQSKNPFNVRNLAGNKDTTRPLTVDSKQLQDLLAINPSFDTIVKYFSTTDPQTGEHDFSNLTKATFNIGGSAPEAGAQGSLEGHIFKGANPYTPGSDEAKVYDALNSGAQPEITAVIQGTDKISLNHNDYINGDEALHYIQGLSTEQVKTLQRHFAVADPQFARALRGGGVSWGDPTDLATIQMWKSLLYESAYGDAHMNVADLLKLKEQNNYQQYNNIVTGKDQLGAITADLTDPASIHEQARAAYIKEIGRTPTETELGVIVGMIHSAEHGVAAKRQSAALSALNIGGQVDAPPDEASIRSALGLDIPNAGDAEIRKMLSAIAQHESGGDPTAQNPHASASGKYQFTDGTWQGLLRTYGLGAVASQYAHAKDAPESLQDMVALKYATATYNQYHDLRAIPAAWYAGGGAVKDALGGGANYVPGKNNGKLTVQAYVTQMMQKAFGGGAIDTLDPARAEGASQRAMGAIIDIEGVDPAARVAEYARVHNPTEFATHSLGSSFNDVIDLFSGGGAPTGGIG